MSNLYANISKLCAKHVISQYTMCDEVGISTALIAALKVGVISNLDSDSTNEIADYFGIYPEELPW